MASLRDEMSIAVVLCDPAGGASVRLVWSLSETAATDAAPEGASWVAVFLESPGSRTDFDPAARVVLVSMLGASSVESEVGVVRDAARFGAFLTGAFPFSTLDAADVRLCFLVYLEASADAALGG